MMVILLDGDLRIRHTNAAAREILGLAGEEADATVPEPAAESKPAMRAIRHSLHRFAAEAVSAGQTVRAQDLRLPDGTLMEASYQAVIGDGAVAGHLLVAHDITDRVLIRRALEARNLELDTLAELKTSFLATVAHELRTPLTAITSLLDLIDLEGSASATHDLLDAVRSNAECLRTKVDDLLVAARIEARTQELDHETIDASGLIRRAAPDPVRFTGHAGPVFVRGDPRWLSLMFTRLFAAAYSKIEPDTELSVRLGVAGRRWTASLRGTTAEHPGADTPMAPDLTVATAIAHRHGGRVAGRRGAVLVSVSLPTLLPSGT